MIEFLRRTPFARILFPYVCGIILADRFPAIPRTGLALILLPAFVMLLLSLRKPGYYRDTVAGILFNLVFLLCGMVFTLNQNRPVLSPSGEQYSAILLECPVKKTNSYRAEAILTHVRKGDSLIRAREKLLIYFGESEETGRLEPGSRVVFERTPEMILNRGNPFEFDYKKYINRKAIYRQVYLGPGYWRGAGTDPRFRIVVTAEKTRDFLLNIYHRNGLEGNEFEILSALTLGYRKSIDPEIKQVFAVTGASHVLAVSGLHVGIVYLFITLVFGFLKKGRMSRIIFFILSVTSLWSFAFITGLSPSVQRAALMFTVVAAGENLHRPTNIYNTLAASAFILMVFNPNLFFDAGFELSYAAVLGIVYFQPRLVSLFHPGNRLVNYLWGLFTVSVAAQITTFPLSASYFHQFPVYFWMSNLVVIPAAFVFIMLGIVILVTSPLPAIPAFIATVAGYLVKGVYFLLQQIGSLPGSLVAGFRFPFSYAVVTFFLLMFLLFFIETKRKGYFFLALYCIPVMLFIAAIQKFADVRRREIIVYNSSQPLIHCIDGKTNYVVAPARILQTAFPPGEVASVVTGYGLDPPIPVAWEADYADAYFLKHKMFLFFGGKKLAVDQGKSVDLTKIEWDAVIVPYELPASESLPPQTCIVCCAQHRGNANEAGRYFRVREEGAWRMRIDRVGLRKNKLM